MKRMLFNATYQEELRVATVEGEKLINFDIETSSKTQRRGNIYKGVITRIEPSLEACFIDYGTEKQGFLPFKEIDSSYLGALAGRREISKLPEGTELIIQVEKDERGNKGAALTTHISLPGRYLVLMPNSSRSGGISRRIDGDERDELKGVLNSLELPEGMSVIARTAALGRVPEELQWDLNYLVKLWDAIKAAASSHKGSFLIYQESNLVVRSIRDHFSPDIGEILIDTQEIYQQARQFINHVMPSFTERVKLYNDDVPLFSRFQIEHQIETAYGRVVHLPSGGSIVIDRTEALTAIDVNSAKANKGSDIEATALATNMEAAEEVARQLRLRDLGGLIVVDFIDMEVQKNQREVENFFKQKLSLDRSRIQMGKLSNFGLLELSRQRVQASLEESSAITCPRCEGMGTIRGIESTAVHVLRLIAEEVIKNASYIAALHVQLPVAVATYLLNEKRADVAKIEARTKVKVVLIPNVHLESPRYKIRKIMHTSTTPNVLGSKASYHLAENLESVTDDYRPELNRGNTDSHNHAMVKHVSHVQHPKLSRSPRNFFKRLLGIAKKVLGNNKTHKTHATKPKARSNVRVSSGSNGGGTSSVTPNNINSENRRNNNSRSTRGSQQRSRYNDSNSRNRSIAEKTEYEPRRTAGTTQSPTTDASTNLASVTPAKSANSVVAPAAAQTAAHASSTAPAAKKVEHNIPPRINTITQAVDLGDLQLVSTSEEAQKKLASVVLPEVNAVRYNDRPVVREVYEEINYQQVETTTTTGYIQS